MRLIRSSDTGDGRDLPADEQCYLRQRSDVKAPAAYGVYQDGSELAASWSRWSSPSVGL